MKRRTSLTLLAGAMFAAASGFAFAQAETGKLFRSKDLNETALIDALTPPEPGTRTRTRSIRVRPTSQSPSAAATQSTARPGAASVLITFETDSTEIDARARAALDVVGRALNSDRLSNLSFSVEGHADPRGGSDYNLRLSQARAESVVEYLVRHHDISRQRLRPLGKGDRELANPARPTAEENRRVTFKTQIE